MINVRPQVLGPVIFAAVIAAVAGACSSASAPTWTFPPAAPAIAPSIAPAVAGASGSAGSGSGTLSTAQSVSVAYAPPPAGSVAPVATAGSSGVARSSGSAGSAVAVPTGSTATASVYRLDLSIVTGDMIGKTEYPAYVPSDFTLPAYSTVVVTITNFDDATPLPAATARYATAAGIVGGTFSVTPIKVSDPNGTAGATTVASALDPKAVSHTFTVPGLGINVPIAAHSRVSFTINTGAPGTFAWRCYDPCGAGTAGWGTAMAARRNYMEGTLVVA